MLKLLNTKVLIAVLAVLAALAGTVLYKRHEAEKAAAILEERKQEDEAFRLRVEEQKKRHNAAAGNEGKTWRTYVP